MAATRDQTPDRIPDRTRDRTVDQDGETPVRWDAPGPGTWELDTAHVDPTVSRIVRDLFSTSSERGLAEGFELMGAPLRTVGSAFVNGRYYLRLVPLVGASRDLPDPPRAVMWLVTRLHPEFRRRAKRSTMALEQRMWLSEFERWNRTWKPRLLETNRRFGSVDETSLSEKQLADHVEALMEHLDWSTTLHFRIHSSDLGPIGRLLTAGADWGLDPKQIMAALTGSSPSTSAPSLALDEIRDELDEAGVIPASLDDVRATSPAARDLLGAYLDEYGSRLTTGYDVRDLTLAELPEVVLASILDGREPADGDAHDAASRALERGNRAIETLRAQVPSSDREEFDMLVDDARLLYGLRDENGPLTYEWPAGILRRSMLEGARRLAASGRIGDEEHIFDASAAEFVTMLRGASTPSASELAGRCAERMTWPTMEPPPFLGRPPSEPPIDVLPGSMPMMMRSVLTVMALLEGDDDDDDLSGTGVGDATYRGTARVVASADEAFDRAEPGDVIVTRLTVPTYNSVLAMAGGVVTENGGLLCHTAVIARELGIPAIVGVKGALQIPDGAEIELDPVTGRVTVLTP